MSLRLSAAARRDLDGIWAYTAEHWSVEQADRYVRQIGEGLAALSTGTATVRRIDFVRPGYFKLSVGSHVVFFKQPGDDIDVVRILHRRMDPERHLV